MPKAMNRPRRRGRVVTFVNFIALYSMCLTNLTVSFLPSISKEKYDNLPIYCQPSTGYFKCHNSTTGVTYCLPNSLKCRVRCSNNAHLMCPGYADACPSADQFPCPTTVQCIADHLVCDGRPHCPSGADESLELCKSRTCSEHQFPCRSPGHCLPASMRCDGSFDCEQTGLGDFSDELDCPRLADPAACRSGEFRCPEGTCIPAAYVCDRFRDCSDGSDEAACPADACDTAAGEFSCDGRCLKAALRCDGVADCASGADEVGCTSSKCKFNSEFFCRLSQPQPLPSATTTAAVCVSTIFVCDGQRDCPQGEDEVCAMSNTVVCNSDAYWTCKSGLHCVRADSRCDGLQHCPDGSDERGCPHPANATAASAATVTPPSPGPTGARQSTPQPCPRGYRASPSVGCRDVDECVEVFGACDQLCVNSRGSFTCGCLPGYELVNRIGESSGTKVEICRAVGGGKLLLATETGIHLLDSDTGTVAKLPTSGVDLKLPKFLDFDASRKQVFFHTRDGLVGSLKLDDPTGSVTVLMTDSVLDALAYDWTRGLVFFTVPETAVGDPDAAGSGYVGVLDVAQGRHSVLKRVSCPRGLALQPSLGLIYISLWCGPKPGIYSMRMDGWDLRPLVTDLKAPGHLALDIGQPLQKQRLYWLDTQLRGVFSCRLTDGGDLRAVWHMGQGYDGLPLGLAVFEDRVTWADLRARGVLSVDKFSGASMHLVARGPGNETVLSAVPYHSVRQPVDPGLGGPLGLTCRCSGHVCINLTVTGAAPAVACLCDQWHVMSGAGVCMPATTLPASSGSVSTAAPVAAESQQQQQQQQQQVVAVAAASAALIVCLACGAAVAWVCMRRSAQLNSFLSAIKEGGGGGGGSGGGGGDSGVNGVNGVPVRHPMPKINSRTPLTECEIGLEDQSQC